MGTAKKTVTKKLTTTKKPATKKTPVKKSPSQKPKKVTKVIPPVVINEIDALPDLKPSTGGCC